MKKFCVVMGLLILGVVARPGQANAQSITTRVVVSATAAPVLVKPDPAMTPLRVAKEGSVLNVIGNEGEWYRIEFQDPQFGRRVGYIEKRHVTVQMAALLQEPVDVSVTESRPARSVSGLGQPQVGQAAQGSVPTTTPQPTRPPAVSPSQQNRSTQWGDVAVGYVFLSTDGESIPFGFAASDAWRVHPSVDVAVESQFSRKTYDFKFVSDAATEWSVLAGPRFWFGSRYGQGTRAFGQVLGGMLSRKRVLEDGIYGLGMQPGFGVEVPIARAVAIRPQFDLMIGRLPGETGTDNRFTVMNNRFKVNVVFRLSGE